ncbi:MAG: glycosyltransferase family protein, partial [Rhodospirillaceae bacterium]|nr:glycosyltransferase family protein [Rhodospirillaceae bacterium]
NAEAHYKEAVRLDPGSASYVNNLGTLYSALGRFDLARGCFERCYNLDPARFTTIENLAGVYRSLNAYAELDRLATLALKRWPEEARFWIYRAEAAFGQGRLAEGWRHYAWRTKIKDKPVVLKSAPGIAAWQGEDIANRSVLVWTEQGPGDEIMYGTMLKDVQARARHLSIVCSPRLKPLFERALPKADVYADAFPADKAGEIDVQAPLAALAETLRPALEAFPASAAYLSPDAAKVEALRAKYRAGGDNLLVGIAWRSSGVDDAARKTVSLGVWGALLGLPRITFVNLQYGDTARELKAVATEFGVKVLHDPEIDSLKDMDAFAAQVAAMDVVVCSSNTTAHVAGGLGVDTHCMVPHSLGMGRRWYWFERDGHSAWYPSVRLWAQSAAGSWMQTIRDVTLALADTLIARGYTDDLAAFLYRLCDAYRKAGQHQDGDAVLNAVLRLPAHKAMALYELGRSAQLQNRPEEAERFFDEAIAADPAQASALNAKGMILAARGDYAAAEPLYRRALAVAPIAEHYNNLGTSLRRQGKGSEAHEMYVKADALKPLHASILLNLATNLTEINRPAEAIPAFQRLLALEPDHQEAHTSKAFAHLSLTEFKEGWAELRWGHPVHHDPARPKDKMVKKWAGEPLAGKRVLAWIEHGLGDQILAASMLQHVIDAAGAVVVACEKRLVPLLQRSFPAATVIEKPLSGSSLAGQFDYQVAMAEMGAGFRLSLDDFPVHGGFLKADPDATACIRARYKNSGAPLLVGVSWKSANPEVGALKSLRLADLVQALPSAHVKSGDLTLVNLQYGDLAQEIAEAGRQFGAHIINDDAINPLKDMDAFAAQVAALDLVITVSNTTAHVAGALGVPTMLLVPVSRGRYWYWYSRNGQSLWYPSIRCCPQGADQSWSAALDMCRDEIKTRLAAPEKG